jgi:hypothetical protein
LAWVVGPALGVVAGVVDLAGVGGAAAAGCHAGAVADAQEPVEPGARKPVAGSGIELGGQACPVGVLGGDVGQHRRPPAQPGREPAGAAAGERGE